MPVAERYTLQPAADQARQRWRVRSHRHRHVHVLSPVLASVNTLSRRFDGRRATGTAVHSRPDSDVAATVAVVVRLDAQMDQGGTRRAGPSASPEGSDGPVPAAQLV